MDFTNKIVLITGASRGIGRECAIQFAEAGAKIAVHYASNEAAADKTRDASDQNFHGRCSRKL